MRARSAPVPSRSARRAAWRSAAGLTRLRMQSSSGQLARLSYEARRSADDGRAVLRERASVRMACATASMHHRSMTVVFSAQDVEYTTIRCIYGSLVAPMALPRPNLLPAGHRVGGGEEAHHD